MLAPTKLLTLIANKMVWQNAKTHLHSHNIAHSETPGFKRVDLKKFDAVLKTNISTMKKRESLLSPTMTIDSSHQVQTGDEVKRDVESMELAENAVNHQANAQLYKKYLGINKLLIGKT
ncbi:flagellar basal body rod protein FlgB [Candidatus Paracaedibacter symbiosus]|uniref:flagellar basal body rod protein FlgB n=1 Tax=Candidatus Paracaedibacter symbiosus TaxID=244582 RepID=UPI000509CB59|nr:hypothetical protein [Candidatus Paracaedibacter symbiosus]